VLDAYRDSNAVLGDIIKVTPSSKCVGDLALYLVTRNLNAADLLDPAKASSIDFPESVVGLLRGDLGFPHKGFPDSIEKVVLKGASKRTIRAGLTMEPVDFEANIRKLSTEWQCEISPEQAMSSLMYPKVFSDYMKVMKNKGGHLMRYLPTPVYLHGCVLDQQFTINIPSKYLQWNHNESTNESYMLLPQGSYTATDDSIVSVNIKLERVTSLKNNKREVIFNINGTKQIALVKDNTAVFVYEGDMVTPGKHVITYYNYLYYIIY
jgi:pyruvate carboxylase